jgi:hypothetical protein
MHECPAVVVAARCVDPGVDVEGLGANVPEENSAVVVQFDDDEGALQSVVENVSVSEASDP